MRGNNSVVKIKAEALREAFFSTFWDEKTGFFYDYDVEMECLQPIMSNAHFWAYYVFSSTRGDYIQLKKLNHNLLNPHKFLTLLPIPTIALDSEFYTNDMWQGPVWISQNYWILKALKHAKQSAIAHNIACQILGRLSLLYSQDNKIYEFYSPMSEDISTLHRKGSIKGPHPHYIGHMPIHAIYYEFIDNK